MRSTSEIVSGILVNGPRCYVAPDLTEELLQANQPRFLMLKHIRSIDIPLDWRAQRALFARYRAQ